MSAANRPTILTYDIQPAAYRPYDPRAPFVAEIVREFIEMEMPSVEVEHIGSTAIPGCDGKGVVDMMMLYQPGGLEASRDAVERLGFVRFDAPDGFPITRPVYLGAFEYNDTLFRLHVHIIAADAQEVADQRLFRDRLRADHSLVDAYVAKKREILERGITHGPSYADEKTAFIEGVRRSA
ncbi:MAG: GrpB family protein [Thermomicrobiales bacterium]